MRTLTTRILAVSAVMAVSLIAVAVANAATLSLSATSGPVGTPMTVSGSAPECPGTVELYFLVGSFSGGLDINLGQRIPLAQDGSFSSTFAAPDPMTSLDPRNPKQGLREYEVNIRCIDGPQLLSQPPSFRFDGRCTVPTSLRGISLPAARESLRLHGCTVGRLVRVERSAVPRNRVITAGARSGATFADAARVALRVSAGRCVVPRIAPGAAVKTARAAITRGGCRVGSTSSIATGAVAAGKVVRLSRPARSIHDWGTKVNIVVARRAPAKDPLCELLGVCLPNFNG
jgi:hypothetical protein